MDVGNVQGSNLTRLVDEIYSINLTKEIINLSSEFPKFLQTLCQLIFYHVAYFMARAAGQNKKTGSCISN